MEMFAATITAIVVLIVCNIAHNHIIKDYEKEIERCRAETVKWLDLYYDLLNKIVQEKIDQAEQVDNTPADYIMD
jgi:hypothetical protein